MSTARSKVSLFLPPIGWAQIRYDGGIKVSNRGKRGEFKGAPKELVDLLEKSPEQPLTPVLERLLERDSADTGWIWAAVGNNGLAWFSNFALIAGKWSKSISYFAHRGELAQQRNAERKRLEKARADLLRSSLSIDEIDERLNELDKIDAADVQEVELPRKDSAEPHLIADLLRLVESLLPYCVKAPTKEVQYETVAVLMEVILDRYVDSATVKTKLVRRNRQIIKNTAITVL